MSDKMDHNHPKLTTTKQQKKATVYRIALHSGQLSNVKSPVEGPRNPGTETWGCEWNAPSTHYSKSKVSWNAACVREVITVCTSGFISTEYETGGAGRSQTPDQIDDSVQHSFYM
jgi:hypothetical protein